MLTLHNCARLEVSPSSVPDVQQRRCEVPNRMTNFGMPISFRIK
jgi:hypothetical protein